MFGYSYNPQMTNPNTIHESSDKSFYVSYNTVDSNIYGDVTTALVWAPTLHFYILNGDHREQYKKLIPLGWQACFDYFMNNKDKWNKHTEKENCHE